MMTLTDNPFTAQKRASPYIGLLVDKISTFINESLLILLWPQSKSWPAS
jgi:hypothetical protein